MRIMDFHYDMGTAIMASVQVTVVRAMLFCVGGREERGKERQREHDGARITATGAGSPTASTI